MTLSLLVVGSVALAEQTPRGMLTDQRIKVVPFRTNEVVPINGTTFTSTQIVFSQLEQIVDITGGDAAAWTTNVDKGLPNTLNIKPTVFGSNTNLTVVTRDHEGQRKNYYFHLMSNTSLEDKINTTYAVHFTYPEDERRRLQAKLAYEREQQASLVNQHKTPKDYNWDFSFSGDRRIMPLHVYDDGKFTYLQLREEQDIPAIFAVDNQKGEEAVVNFRREGNILIILQRPPQLTLRAGKYCVASIFNNQVINKIRKK